MSRKLYGTLILLSLIWGGSFYFIKILLEDFGPWTIAFFRSGTGLVTIIGIMLVLRKPFGFKRMAWGPMAIVAMLNTAVPWALIAHSETLLTSGMASVLNATTPMWTLLVGLLFFGGVFNRMQGLGLVMATLGLIVLLDVNPVSIISVDPIGLLAMMAATFCYGLSSQLSKRYLGGMSMYQIAFGTLLCGMIGSGFAAFTFEQVNFAPLASLHHVGVLVGLGAFGSGLAYILFYSLLQKGSPEFAASVTYLVPATAILWGATLLGEELRWSLLAGLALILGGVYMANRKPRSVAAAVGNEA
ncbi:multidrug transporter [Paenibacillus swuensis]|uniref:Multidrug transporter n=1 Tax=Paenibacillus swuensis TaxID=1178515 RepID=A0A172TE39_9BACL|nr:DMT family transporter [Paenibacillus swuensis]ANE45309.1 multidrug transporter [Paenibacillus swuensis]